MKPSTIALLALPLIVALACTQSSPDSPTPNIDATIQAAVAASIPTPTTEPTPDVDATVSAAIVATKEAGEQIPTDTPQPTPIDTPVPTPTNTPEPTPTELPTATAATPTETPTPPSTPTPVLKLAVNTFPATRTFYGPESGELVPDEEGTGEIVSAVDIADLNIEVAVTRSHFK